MLRVANAALVFFAAVASCNGADVTSTASAQRFTTGLHPNDAVIGDFDGDGDLDILVPGLVTPTLTTLLNTEGGLLHHSVELLATGASYATSADLDSDGDDEVLLSNREWSSIVVLGLLDGAWTILSEIPIAGAEQVATGDLDGDGFLDLAASRFNYDDVVIVTNLGRADESQVTIPVAARPQSLVILPDRLEVAVSEAKNDSVAFLAAAENGWQVRSRVTTPAWPISLLARDLDGDGSSEVAGAANLDDSLFVLRWTGDRWTAELVPAGSGAFGVAVLEGPSGQTVVVSNKFDDSLFDYSNRRGELVYRGQTPSAEGPSPVYAADLDGSGEDDLVVVDAFADSVSVYFNY